MLFSGSTSGSRAGRNWRLPGPLWKPCADTSKIHLVNVTETKPHK